MKENIKMEIKEYEKKSKDVIFNGISELIENENNNIKIQNDFVSMLGLHELKIPNVSITMNNKIVEISHIFKDNGISMFAEYSEKDDSISFPFISEIIVFDMITRVHNSTDIFGEIHSLTEKMLDTFTNFIKENNNLNEISKKNPIKKIFLKSKIDNLDNELGTTFYDSICKLYKLLDDYNKINDKIFEYSLDKDFVSSIKNYFLKNKEENNEISYLLEEKVFPKLKELKLDSLIVEIKDCMIDKDILNSKKSIVF